MHISLNWDVPMEHDLLNTQYQYFQKLQKLQQSLQSTKIPATPAIQNFQMGLMQVGMKFWGNMMRNPDHLIEAQRRYLDFLQQNISNDNAYARYFKSEEWQDHPYFQWLKDIYIKTATWMIETIEEETLGFNEDERQKLLFLTRQITESMNPRNFPLTNPDVIQETLDTKGENLLRGMDNLIADIERGRISMTDDAAFKVGENIATTKGDVVFQNHMMELIHYHPTTDKVFAEPILIIPPWINKYYILDLTPENSFIKWMVDQGHSVFCISWKNPDESYRDIGFQDYMHEGVLKAADIATKAHDNAPVNAIGYCIGGTLLGMTQAWLKGQKKPSPFHTATYLTTLLDFEQAGDLKIFVDDEQIESLNQVLIENGVMDGKSMSLTFSLLRASDLIWSFVINNYFMGKDPVPFDLLYWNSDSTNLPAAMHADYLRSMYLHNALADGNYVLDGVRLNLGDVDTPSYFFATRDDHIAPWQACQAGTSLLKGDNTFVLGGSGHIAGVINPPHKNKYGYQVDGQSYDGSWWPHWHKWVSNRNKQGKIAPPRNFSKKYSAAPGTYVLQKL